MHRKRFWWGIAVGVIGLGLLGSVGVIWANQRPIAVVSKAKPKRPLTAAQKRRRRSDQTDGVGRVLRTRVGSSRVPYQLANDNVKLYDSLAHVHNRYHVTVEGDEEELAAPIKVVVAKYFKTEKGTYCLIQNLHYKAVTKPFKMVRAQTWTKLRPNHDWGYIALKDLRRTTFKRSVTTLPKVPYYLTSFEGKNPSNLAMNLSRTTVHAWSNVPGTVFRAFAHDTDTLLNQQFYAVKRLVRTDGRRYLLLQTATGRRIGWLPVGSQLVAGTYHDAGTTLLKPQPTELVTHSQQRPIRLTEDSGYLSRSRLTWVTNRQRQLQRVLILTPMNTPIKLVFKAGHAQQITFYQPNRHVHRVINVHFKKGTQQRTYTCHNDYDNVGKVTVYRQAKSRLATFSDGDDDTDEEGYTATGTLYRDQTASFKSGLWSNQDD